MRQIIFTLILISSTANLFGQYKIGLKGGLNYSNVDIKYSDNSVFQEPSTKYKIGYQIGGYINKKINEKIYLGLEIQYSRKGYSYDIDKADSTEIILNFIDFDFLVNYALTQKFSIEFGPELSKLISASYKVDAGDGDLTDLYSKGIAFSLLAGIRYNLSNRVATNFKFSYGLSDINESSIFGFTDINERTRSFQLGLYYNLN